MKVLVVYNRQAGHKWAKKLLPQVKNALAENNLDFDLTVTEHAGHAIEIAGNADFDNYDGIVAGGGDGTLFEVINGYFKNSSSKRIPMGILPMGTGNAFARDLNLDIKKWREAVKIIAQNKTRKVDVGHFRTLGKDYYFLNILGLGFVADVGITASKIKILGNLSYTIGVILRTLFLKADKLNIEIDGKSMEQQTTFVEISNTRYTSNFLMAPDAKIDDGLLDITVVGKMSRRRLLKCYPTIFTGEHILFDEVDTYKAKSIKVDCDVPKILTPDGELMGSTPLEAECLHQAIEVFWS